ncbi:SAM-dependent methyltransferase [Streptomyces antimicrobicus]|uniref:SAM-dependent methyltransferase n=1 Tax=Streptomyces antimicrobicus TaxID=2883108 RepID=A0ABS8B6U4_9ACTN|nr:SAM-dependent methyltransferase [Streptomyces antimicrobicus]MCB5180327.1 SAM-dependent methyltransferase [Streptomyces antimicrobicus]
MHHDVRRPSVARIYDWLLGGVDNYPSDHRVGADLLDIAPGSRTGALSNRAFLRRAVHVLARDYGIRQFLEHGCGLPARDNVHEVAQAVAPDARVVYVDNDPLVVAHARTRLVENPRTAVVDADVRDTAAIFADPAVRRLIRPDEPTAALFVSVAQCLGDEDVTPMIERVKQRLAPGSFVVLCQFTSPYADVRERVTRLMREATDGSWGRLREEEEVRGYLDGLEIIEPGLGDVAHWRAERRPTLRDAEAELIAWGGVGRLPAQALRGAGTSPNSADRDAARSS